MNEEWVNLKDALLKLGGEQVAGQWIFAYSDLSKAKLINMISKKGLNVALYSMQSNFRVPYQRVVNIKSKNGLNEFIVFSRQRALFVIGDEIKRVLREGK